MTRPSEDPTINEDLRRVTGEVTNRLEELGIWLDGEERPEDLAQLLEAVERFELAVQTRGGDLMVDEGPSGKTTQPDNVDFALPERASDESLVRYVERLELARDQVMRQPSKE